MGTFFFFEKDDAPGESSIVFGVKEMEWEKRLCFH